MKIPGTMLKTYRLKAGMTQKNLCGIMKRTEACISDWEVGRRPIPERHNSKLAFILGVSEEILTDSVYSPSMKFSATQLYIATHVNLLFGDELAELLAKLAVRSEKHLCRDMGISEPGY